MTPLDFYLKALAAAGSLLFGAIIVAGGPRRRANQLLAAFLFLIAGNQAVEAYRALEPTALRGIVSFRWAAAFAVADPLLLYSFAASYPRRNRLARPVRWVPLAAAAVLLLAWVVWLPAPDVPDARLLAGETALALYTVAAYACVWLWALDRTVAGQGPPGMRLLYAAMCCAAIPVVGRVAGDLGAALRLAWPRWGGLGMAAWVLAVPFLAIAHRRSRIRPSEARFVLSWAAFGVVLGVFVGWLDVSEALLHSRLGLIGQGGAAIRWLLFGGLVSMAVVRHEMLGMSMGLRRTAARLLVAFAFVGAASLALAIGGWASGETRPRFSLELAVLVGALLLSQGFRAVVNRVATALYGVPDRSDPAAAADAYRLALLQAADAGRSAAPALRRLQAELGLDDRTAVLIAAVAAETQGGPLAVGQLLAGRFRVTRFLGRGGAGRAFLARDELLHRTVVLKEVLTGGPEDEAAVLREARLAAGLQHPNVVTLHDVIRRPGAALLVSEHVDGGSLEERLSAGALGRQEALHIADGVLAGLEAIHARGIVHRDLKPANVLLGPGDVAKITDFGIARSLRGATADLHTGPQGTPECMAPEQRRGAAPTPASDCYQAGLLLKALFPGRLPRGLAAVVRRSLLASPGKRPSVRELRAALGHALRAAR